jgi:hypothetical protein
MLIMLTFFIKSTHHSPLFTTKHKPPTYVQVDMQDLLSSRPAPSATAAAAGSHGHPTRLPLGTTPQRPGSDGRRALKLRDCNAWSPVAYTDMQVRGHDLFWNTVQKICIECKVQKQQILNSNANTARGATRNYQI